MNKFPVLRSFETFIATRFTIMEAGLTIFRYTSENFYSRDDTFHDIRFGFAAS